MAIVACAWCGKELQTGLPGTFLSHGMCVSCSGRNGFFPVEELRSIRGESIDHFPPGEIEIDRHGVIREYRWSDGADGGLWGWILGKHFFAEVAPWDLVQKFEGQFKRLVGSGRSGAAELAFLSRTPICERLVFLELTYNENTGRGIIAIEQLA